MDNVAIGALLAKSRHALSDLTKKVAEFNKSIGALHGAVSDFNCVVDEVNKYLISIGEVEIGYVELTDGFSSFDMSGEDPIKLIDNPVTILKSLKDN